MGACNLLPAITCNATKQSKACKWRFAAADEIAALLCFVTMALTAECVSTSMPQHACMPPCRVDVGIMVAMVVIYRTAFWLACSIKEKMR